MTIVAYKKEEFLSCLCNSTSSQAEHWGKEDEVVDLMDVAARLDADEKLRLEYRFPVRSAEGRVEYERRSGQLLDIAEEARLLYVSHEGEILWIKIEEAIEVTPEAA